MALETNPTGYEFEQTLGDTEGQESLGMLQLMGLQRGRHDLAPKQQSLVAAI